MSQLKNIIFDLGGVLLNLDVARCMDGLERIGLHEVRKWITGTNEAGFFKEYECGLLTTAQFRDEIRKWTSRPLADGEIDGIWNSMLKDIPPYKLELLCDLRKKYNLFLLSNTNELHWQVCTGQFACNGMRVQDYFTRIFLSFQMHLAKPDVEIFRVVCDTAGIEAEESLFVDDSMENCRAAASLGIHTLHYTPGDDLKMQLQKIIE